MNKKINILILIFLFIGVVDLFCANDPRVWLIGIGDYVPAKIYYKRLVSGVGMVETYVSLSYDQFNSYYAYLTDWEFTKAYNYNPYITKICYAYVYDPSIRVWNYYPESMYNGNTVYNDQILDFTLVDGFTYPDYNDYRLNYSYTNNFNIPVWYEFYNPVDKTNMIGVLKPGEPLNISLDYKTTNNVSDNPFLIIHTDPDQDQYPFDVYIPLSWNTSGYPIYSGGSTFNDLQNHLNPTNDFNLSTDYNHLVYTNGNFYKINTFTDGNGNKVVTINQVVDLSDILSELRNVNKSLSRISTNSENTFSNQYIEYLNLTNNMVNTNITGMKEVIQSINIFNPQGIVPGNSISGEPSSDFWRIRIPLNNKEFYLTIPVNDPLVLQFFSWINSFCQFVIKFFYYVFCVYLAYKLVSDTLQTPAHVVNGAAIMGTHTNFLIAKACLGVILVLIAAFLQQFLTNMLQTNFKEIFEGWQSQTYSVSFLSEAFKLFLRVFPVSLFMSYLASGLIVFFNFWVFKSTLQILKNAMA